LGGGTVKLGYVVDDGVITISTAEDLASHVVTRVYEIRDLITEHPDAPAAGRAEAAPQPTTQPQAKLVEQVQQLIQETVEPQAWRDAGGTIASMRELSGQLIVTATPEMQRSIATLLHQIREGRGVQVTVEMRFFTADPADLDKALGGKLLGTMGKSGQATVWHLSDAQVQAVLREFQQQSNSTIVTAPRITLFNGQRGTINVSAETPYTAGYTVFKKDGGETRYEPTIDKVASGIFIDVRGTASADRKQATLTIHPKFSFLQALRPAPYVGSKDLTVQVPELIVHELQTTLSLPDRGTALIGGFTESGGASAASGPSATPATARVEGDQIVLERPVKTRVKVPDGGKVVLGGSEPASATEGVPLLRRLTADLDRSQNLFLLVKPTLVITQPQAPKEFPLLSNSPRR
jgi:type II secretory pathway component GspD/PulD (secretin)